MVSTQAAIQQSKGCAATGVRQRYVRHKPEQTPLYPIIVEHAHRFFADTGTTAMSRQESLNVA
jgi:hypothetical protein